MRLRQIQQRLVSVWLGLLLAGRVQGADAPISRIADLRALTKETAATAVPVRVQGVVIAVETNSFVIHDAAAGLFVQCPPGVSVPSFGREVMVDGVTDPGEFAPIVQAKQITELGNRELAPLVIKQVEELESGRLDCRWVEVEGLLRSAQPYSPAEKCFTAYAVLATGLTRLNLSFSATSFAEVQQWVGSRVRLRAACGHYFNSHGQHYGTRLVVPRTVEVTVLQEALPRGAVPLTRIDSLLRFSVDEPSQGRVHIRGVVTWQGGEGELYVQQGQRGVFVRSIDRHQLAVGDTVDVVGYVRRGLYSPEIEDAEAERGELGGVMVPRLVSGEDAKTADGELVRIEGLVLDNFRSAEAVGLTLKGQGATFTATLPRKEALPHPPAAGSRVQLTGVARAIETPAIGAAYPWTPSSFELRLRTGADLVVLARPAVSLAVWAFGGATALSSLDLLVAGTRWWQSKARLREQKRRRIAREAEFAAIMQERMRLAREIHDSLAQGYTAVSIQDFWRAGYCQCSPTPRCGDVPTLDRARARSSNLYRPTPQARCTSATDDKRRSAMPLVHCSSTRDGR